MSTLNDLKHAALLNSTGATPPITINELEILRLIQLGFTGTLNEMYMQLFIEHGITEGTFNGRFYQYLGDRGCEQDTLNERQYCFWSGGGSTGFCYARLEFNPDSPTVFVKFTDPADSSSTAGFSVKIDDVGIGVNIIGGTWDGDKLQTLTLDINIPLGSKVSVSYDGAGTTIKDAAQLCTFTDELATETTDGEYAFAAAGSLYMLTDGDLTTGDVHHKLHPQVVGIGTPNFSIPNELFLPDHEGVYHYFKGGNTAPWHGARLVDAGLGLWDAYSNDAPDSNTPLAVMPKLYASPAQLNRNPRSHKLANWTPQGIGGVNQNIAVGLDGTISASRVTDTDSGQFYATTMEVPVNATAQITSQWAIAKRVSQTAWVGLGNQGGGGFSATYIAFNQVTGDYNVIAGAYTKIIVDGSNPDFWFITMEQANIGTVFGQKVWAALSTDGTTLDASAQGYVDVAYASVTDESTAHQVAGSAPIMTNGSVAESQAAIGIDYDPANFSNDKSAWYCEVTPQYAWDELGGISNPFLVAGLGSGGWLLYDHPSGQRFTSYDGTNSCLVNSVFYDGSTVLKLGIPYDVATPAWTINGQGVYGTEVLKQPAFAGTRLSLGFGVTKPFLIGNLRRYNLPYIEGKAKIDELMALNLTTHQATIGSNSPNFGTGSQFTTPAGLPTPTTFMGLEIAYVGSFGEFFWNARFGAAGNEQLAGVDILRVKMGDTTVVDLSWNQAQLRYQGNSAGGESLWTILGDDVGQTVQLLLQDVT